MNSTVERWYGVAIFMAVLLLVGVGVGIGAVVFGSSAPQETVIHYVTVARSTQETSALKQCATSSQNEQSGAPGSPKIYGECVYWVEKAFSGHA